MLDPKAELDLRSPVGDWLARSIGTNTRPVRSKRLICGDSSPVHLVDVEHDGRREKFVLRLFMNEGWLRNEPDLARHEATVLEHAVAHGLPAPQVVAYAEDASACGYPAVLMTFLYGTVRLTSDDRSGWLTEMAGTLAMIHSVPARDIPWTYFSFTDEKALGVPKWAKRPDLWKEAIRIRNEGPPDEESVFLHRDYHPVNLLWNGDQVVGIVDWVNACAGPAGIDVAHCCTNLAFIHGPTAVSAFRQAYQEASGKRYVYHPYWDVDTIMDWAMPAPEFYPPWGEYGIRNPGQQALFDRHEAVFGIRVGEAIAVTSQ